MSDTFWVMIMVVFSGMYFVSNKIMEKTRSDIVALFVIILYILSAVIAIAIAFYLRFIRM